MKQILSAALVVTAFILPAPARAQKVAATPAAAVEELLQADREFSRKSATMKAIDALPPMFADEVIVPQSAGTFAEGKAAVVEAMRKNPANVNGTVTWEPIRGGISADGMHGFTYGYMTSRGEGLPETPLKYMSYWVKKPEGWRVVAYKRAPRAAGEVSTAVMAPALPPKLVAPTTNEATIKAFSESLGNAEHSFSDESQKIGLGPAFEKYGSADAVNMGGPASPAFVLGSAEIGKAVSGGGPPEPSPVSWSADKKVIVASSGDLGITLGVIRGNAPDANGNRAAFSFFTIWRRNSPTDRWLYVAE